MSQHPPPGQQIKQQLPPITQVNQQQLHLLHHIKQDTNFSFMNHSYDKLSNTYFSDRERFKMDASNS